MKLSDFKFEIDLEADSLSISRADRQWSVYVGQEGTTVTVEVLDGDGWLLNSMDAEVGGPFLEPSTVERMHAENPEVEPAEIDAALDDIGGA